MGPSSRPSLRSTGLFCMSREDTTWQRRKGGTVGRVEGEGERGGGLSGATLAALGHSEPLWGHSQQHSWVPGRQGQEEELRGNSRTYLQAFAVRQLHDVVGKGVGFAPFLAVRRRFRVQGIPDAQVLQMQQGSGCRREGSQDKWIDEGRGEWLHERHEDGVRTLKSARPVAGFFMSSSIASGVERTPRHTCDEPRRRAHRQRGGREETLREPYEL